MTAQTVIDILALGRLLLDERARLAPDVFRAMTDGLGILNADRLMRIAASPLATVDPAQLPPSWTVLHDLQLLPEATLRAALADGRISPRTTRTQARALRLAVEPAPVGKAARLDAIRALAFDGYSPHQIAERIRMNPEYVALLIRRHAIPCPASADVLKSQHRIDANRFVERLATDAENMLAHLDLIEMDTLDGARLDDWRARLKAAAARLHGLIRQLTNERTSRHAACEEPRRPIESPSGPDPVDARPAGPRRTAAIQ